jgi:hypothetical protein
MFFNVRPLAVAMAPELASPCRADAGRFTAALARTIAVAAVGASLGWLAWHENRPPLAAAFLPVLVALCGSRREAFVFAAAYTVVLLRCVAPFIAAWFDDNLLVGGAAVAAFSLCTATGWCLCWTASPRASRKVTALAVGWLVALLPPCGVGAPGHAVLAWGWLLPDSGWVGVIASVAVPSAIVAALQSAQIPRLTAWGACVLSATVLAGWGGTSLPTPAITGLHAMTTHWGRLDGVDDVLSRIQHGGELAAARHERVVVWPESAIGRFDPSYEQVLRLEVLTPAKRRGIVHVIGMDTPDHGQLRNVAVAYFPDGTRTVAYARQPAPVSLWRPWADSGSFVADYRASNVLRFPGAGRIAVIFCYEEYVPFLYLLNEMRDRPQAFLAMSNTWAARYSQADAIQARHSEALARLFGRPYARAVNRPR